VCCVPERSVKTILIACSRNTRLHKAPLKTLTFHDSCLTTHYFIKNHSLVPSEHYHHQSNPPHPTADCLASVSAYYSTTFTSNQPHIHNDFPDGVVPRLLPLL
jgi:hypothetical protein